MQTTSVTTSSIDRLAAFGDLRVVECSRGTAHPLKKRGQILQSSTVLESEI